MAATESVGSTSHNRNEDLELAQADGVESVKMAERIQSFDWSQTALGPIECWPASLRTMVSFMLTDRFPKLLWWGPDYISIYNDAYRPILGAKHPWALGKPVRECWAEIWPVLKPLIDTPFQGGPGTWIEDFELEIHRHGFTEETHFTVAYSPVPDPTLPSGIGGVMATVHEITDKVIGERRITILRDLGARAAKAKTAEEACTLSAEILAEHPKDIPFAMLYLTDADGEHAHLTASTGIDGASEDFRLPSIDLAQRECPSRIWPLAIACATEQTQIVRDLPSKFAKVPSGPWSDLPHTALVLPIRGASGHKLAGFLIIGLSARIELDEKYKSFLELAASQIGSAVVNARAYEEERKRAEALAEIDRAKTSFFSNVSHEFRTPLTLMLGPLEQVLKDAADLPSEQRSMLDTAHRNSLRLLKLVNSLLDFSRIEAGRVKASYEPVELAALTADLAANFRSAMQVAGLEFVVDCQPLSEAAYVDREMWEKIVLNLLSNAFKFTFEGTVAVRLEQRGSHAVLTISDTGVGIPESELSHVFERFHRVEGTRGRTYEGTGIGLALIQELVKFHDGTVEVASRLGSGSTFTVTIPLGCAHLPEERISAGGEKQADSISTHADAYTSEAMLWAGDHPLSNRSDSLPSTPTETSGKRARILIADDNADMRQHISRILSADYEITAVSDGFAALRIAREHTPDLVLADVMMPGLDGFGLLQELRSEPHLREIPVIVVSARAGDEARTEGISAGADDYIVKPFNTRELSARVRTTLDLQRVRREAREAMKALNEEMAFELSAMTRMQQLSTSLGQADELNDLLGQIIEAAIEITRADKGNIQLLQNGVLKIVRQRGFQEPFLNFFNGVEGGQAACGTALKHGERVIVEDVAQSSLYEQTQARDVMLAADVKACQSTPLISRAGKVLGTLSTHYSTAPRTPADRDLRLLDILARQAADLIERQQAETALRESEEQLRLATEHAEIGFWDVDPIHDVLVWPASVKAMFGISSDVPVTMRDFYNGLHPDDRDATSEAYAAAADPNRRALYDVEYRTIGKEDGRVRWVAAKGRGVFDDEGRCVRVIGTAVDITKRKKTETALVESEERLRFGLDAGHMIAWEWDLATGVSHRSGNAAHILGLDASDTEDLHRLVHADDQACVLAIRDAALAGKAEYDIEYRLVLNNGRVIWVVDRARVLRDAKGRPERMVGITMDVTARKTAEEDLRQSEARFRQLADSMPQIVWTAEPDGAIDYLNQRWKEYTDVPEQNLHGAGAWAGFLHPEDLPRVTAYWNEHVSAGEPADIEFRLRRRDGVYRWVLTRAVPLRDAQGCIVKWFGTSTDIDDQKRAEEELRRANRDLEQFAFSASHDLQEPIRNVAIYSQLFKKRYAGKLDEQADKFLGYITEGAKRMVDLVSDLLAYTQAAATDNEAFKPVSTEEALRKVLSSLQRTIQESNAQITHDPLPVVRIKEVHLQQLLQNLIGNAIKYRKDTEPPRIHASAVRENGKWRFSIADNGIGIERQFHDRVFGLFKRLHASGGKYPGTGIGLAICQKIVERYGGRIWLVSEPDKGTTFYFTLPEA